MKMITETLTNVYNDEKKQDDFNIILTYKCDDCADDLSYTSRIDFFYNLEVLDIDFYKQLLTEENNHTLNLLINATFRFYSSDYVAQFKKILFTYKDFLLNLITHYENIFHNTNIRLRFNFSEMTLIDYFQIVIIIS